MTTLQEWDLPFWSYKIIPVFATVVILGLEILSEGLPTTFGALTKSRIPQKGRHLDQFSSTDKLYININKALTVLFVYHVLWVSYYTPSIKWKLDELNLFNTLGSLTLFYIFYDFFYSLFHRILHIPGLYAYVHKHHHRQCAPSRGNLDAINVHPFEFVLGEYLHLLTIFVIPCHIATVATFILLGGILASLNHTRLDLNIPPGIYSVKIHDVHHRLPESNYGQYIMLWDYLFGSYRSYGTKIPEEK